MNTYKFLSYALTLALIIVSTLFLFSQHATATGTESVDTKMLAEHVVLGAGVIIVIMAISTLLYLVSTMMKLQKIRLLQEHGVEVAEKVGFKVQSEPWWKKQYKKWTNVVPVEREKEILFDHQYDGIRELDNSLPPWWVAMFYITIAFAVVYFGYYHVFNYGHTQAEEYAVEMERAEASIKAYLASQADMVDETNVVLITDEMDLNLGKTLYEANCSVCHGKAGEGGVGPNFADEYWIHGGGVKDIFKTIKYGVPEKGMIAWKSQIKPSDIQKIASYILGFQGTNPPNQKEPQGEKYIPSKDTEDDSRSKNSGSNELSMVK